MSPTRRQALLGAASLVLAPRRGRAQAAPPSWPHTVTAQGATITMEQPQVISWQNQAVLNARCAVSITRPGQAQPLLGTLTVAVTTRPDMRTRQVALLEPRLVSSRFPTLDTQQAAALEQRIRAGLAGAMLRSVPLDMLLLAMHDGPATAQTAGLDNDPPIIFHSERPASLIVFDGAPVLAPIRATGLSAVVNTNWDIFVHAGGDGSWYLLDNGAWLAAPAATGPWRPAGRLPAAFGSLPDDGNFTAARAAIPGRTISAEEMPTLFVSQRPAEIIVTQGPPAFAPVPETGLEYATNTHSMLIRDRADQRIYLLLSGRWFSAPGLDGPWSFATPNLPADFARIPPDSPIGSVLSSVPGTSEAQEAVLQAQVPRQATLSRSATRLNVTYAGTPRFEPIPGTSLSYAVNSQYEVLLVGGRYYCCYQGAWFTAPAATGPWVLADSVPAEVRKIPPSHPLHNVTYVNVYAATAAAVTFGYTAGYTAGYVSNGVVVYGTGYYYPPVVIPAAVPVFMPYPYTYAGSVWYNPANGAWARGGAVYGPYGAARGGVAYNPTTGAWAEGGSIYGPYGGAGAFSAYNPSTGGYARGSAVWGPDGGTAQGSFYNPRTGVTGSTTQNWNPYERWGSSTFAGPNQTVRTESASDARGQAGAFSSSSGAEGAGVRGAGGNSAGVVRGAGGNTYAGADGNVYRHTDDGWSKWNDGGWQSVTPPQRDGNTQNSLGGTQQRNPANANPQAQQRRQQGGTPPQRNPGASESETWNQLSRDHQERMFGQERQGFFGDERAGGEGAGRRFGGEGGFSRPFAAGGFEGFRRR